MQDQSGTCCFSSWDPPVGMEMDTLVAPDLEKLLWGWGQQCKSPGHLRLSHWVTSYSCLQNKTVWAILSAPHLQRRNLWNTSFSSRCQEMGTSCTYRTLKHEGTWSLVTTVALTSGTHVIDDMLQRQKYFPQSINLPTSYTPIPQSSQEHLWPTGFMFPLMGY